MTYDPEKRCPTCARVWRVWRDEPCPTGGVDCWECDLFQRIDPEHVGTHREPQDDVDEVVARSCAHGTDYEWRCKKCGTRVGGWGIGAAGFGDLCGCHDAPPETD